MILSLVIVSLLAFGAFNVIPGDTAAIMAGANASPEQVAALREKMGLDSSLSARYFSWLRGLADGDFGVSLRYGTGIGGILRERIPVTCLLAAVSLVIIILISIPLSVVTAHCEGGIIDKSVSFLTTASMSVPNFFLSMIIIWIFGLLLKLFTAGQFIPPTENIGGFFAYIIYPAAAVALPLCGMTVKFLRGELFSEKRRLYVRTAIAGGASRRRVLTRHVLRNAIIPTVTFLGMIIGDIFGGSIVVEQVFGVTGVGRLLITSISARDFPLLQTLVVYIAFIVVLANTLSDAAISIIDPRIRIAK